MSFARKRLASWRKKQNKKTVVNKEHEYCILKQH